MTIPHHSTTSSSIKELLAKGFSKSETAEELGLTPSAITQALASTPQSSQSPESPETNPIDETYDRIEQKLLTQLERTVPLLMRPMEISKVLATINAAKRRGGPLKTQDQKPTVLNLTLPVAIQQRFVVNNSNQVVAAGSQDLVTIQSNNVKKLLDSSNVSAPQPLTSHPGPNT